MSDYDLVGVTIEDQRQAEIAARRAARLADAQRVWPVIVDWVQQALLSITTALTNGRISGIRPGVHLRFRPPRRANRRAHSRKIRYGNH